MARERWRDVGDSVAYAVCLHRTLYRGRSYHWWSVIKNLPSSTLSLQMYSWEHICNNPFIKTSAILLCYSSKSYRWSTRIMSFNPPQPQSSHIGNAFSRKPVCSVAEELYQHSVIIQLSLLLSSRLPLFLLSDSMYEGILKCNDHETYLLSLTLNNAIYPTNLR